jgi:pimeloyl-ACP methyl ester carboxylesterase
MRRTNRNSRRVVAAVALVALGVSACSTTSTTDTTSAPSTLAENPDFPIAPIAWSTCEDAPEESPVVCGSLEVPFDYANPSIGTFQLFVKKRPADKTAVGPLLVNPGGPGFGGSSLADDAMYYFSRDLMNAFDIIAWDPRGTGQSEPAVDCVDEYDPYAGLDSPPDTEQEKQALIEASRAFNEMCVERSGAILPYISTEASARDMNSLRLALGVEKITYMGFSYGSELGATWVTLFPETVRAAVFDGATDPNSTSIEQGMAQAQGFEQQLSAFLAQCSLAPSCPFHNNGDSESAFDQLFVDIDANPLVVSNDRTPVTQGVAYTAVAQAMYSDYYWRDLERALADAQRGNGKGLLDLYDEYYQRKDDGSYGNELEAFLAISCLDDRDVATVEEVEDYVDDFIAVAPRLGANFAYGYTCVLWPVEAVTRIAITGMGAGPIVVIGTTGDAATPLSSSRNMAKALENGILIVVEADQHTGYGANSCVVDAVDRYLIDLKIPDNGTRCSP